jgi:hypothetical protein
VKVETFVINYGGEVRVELRGQISEGEWNQLHDLAGREVSIVVKRRIGFLNRNTGVILAALVLVVFLRSNGWWCW